ncbi:MAG: tRNA (N(6)-L-threonylcarbamoyladenosine(37)-C(2))-methylthiotransferase [Candidatus Diapherotrites archaeon]|nr:tRNA (N(6)-L-threonylcarbamoyladenosine(37)-C(2))-methylthiotransferase [Candidatus Diapherotrites archaeon]
MKRRCKTFSLEGYGCSLNQGDTARIALLLEKAGFGQESPEKADFILINTCAVKTPTENKMLRRVKALGVIAEKAGARLVVCGCLPFISPEKIKGACEKAELLGVDLKEIASFFGIPFSEKNAKIPAAKKNSCISIIPVAHGCLGNCAYCCVKQARGGLKSLPVEEINSAFAEALEGSKEIWLTANDTGCYGLDRGTNLAELLERLLENEGEFRVRLGMMNPANLKKFFPRLLKAMEDERVYKFLHLPVQSGSDRVLGLMERHHTAKEFEALAAKARKKFPEITIATDIIVAFPQETEKDFSESLALLERVKPDIVNVSRFGLRPNTKAALLPGKVHGGISKQRSRALAAKAREIALEKNRLFEGSVQKILVSEKGPTGGFIGRTNSYKPVAVEKAEMCSFRNAKILRAFPTYLEGKILRKN